MSPEAQAGTTAAAEAPGWAGEGVAFVGGCMRTGTTLLQRMLCASPETGGFTSEVQYLMALLDLFERWGKAFETRMAPFFGSRDAYEAHCRRTVTDFVEAARLTQGRPRLTVLKRPELSWHFPRLAHWFPKALFLVTVRDPRDTIASIMEVGAKHARSGQASRLAQMGRDMGQLSDFFLSYYARLNAPPLQGRLAAIRYEDAAGRPEAVLARLSALTGLALSAEAIPPDTFERRERNREDAAFWGPLRERPPSAERIGRYREALSPDEVAIVEARCAAFARPFGYW